MTRLAAALGGLLLLARCTAVTAASPFVVLQFDDGRLTHFTRAFPILQAHGLLGSFAIVTGNVDVSPGSMTRAQLIELAAAGHELHDHTWDHNAAFWGDPQNAPLWPAHFELSRSFFASIGLTTTGWNQPGGPGQGFSPQLHQALIDHGYSYVAGRVDLPNARVMNFHPGLRDDPLALGRGGIYAWGNNAAVTAAARGEPAKRWSAQSELHAILHSVAAAVAQGLVPVPLFHEVQDADSSAWGLDSLCTWLVANGIPSMRMADAVSHCRTAPSVGSERLAALTLDHNGDGRPDGWQDAVAVGGGVVELANNAQTDVYGFAAAAHLVVLDLEVRSTVTTSITLQLERTDVDPVTFEYSTHSVTRPHTIVAGPWIALRDTVSIAPSTDRLLVAFRGLAQPLQLRAAALRQQITVATALVRFTAERVGGSAIVRWSLTQPDALSSLQLWRSTAGANRVAIGAPLPGGRAGGASEGAVSDPAPPLQRTDYWLEQRSRDGVSLWFGPAVLPAAVGQLAAHGTLASWPNPFNPSTVFESDVACAGRVRLEIFNARGVHVVTLLDAWMPPGPIHLPWNGTDQQGRRVPAGTYVVSLRTCAGERVTKACLVR